MQKIVLGVKIDDVSLNEAIKKVEGWISKGGPASPAKRGEKHYIVTTNPEFIVAANSDPEFKKILNNADLAIPDGVGLKLSGDIEYITPGIDLMEALIKMAEEKGFTVGFLGGRDSVAKRTVECLKKKYPKLKVSFIGEEPDEIPATDLLFVAFGHPKQEVWIDANLDKIPVKVAMGVGGAFDFLSGRVPRAPLWFRKLGLEWLFRLAVQPWRINRQLALLKYLMLIWKYGNYKDTERS